MVIDSFALRPDVQQILVWLEQVADPEIPVLSVVDLGVVRAASWHDDVCVITLTPTYSGCPAMVEIRQAIEQCLKQNGIDKVRVETQLAPAWTTDWLTAKGRSALKHYGIAPPVQQAIDITGISRQAIEPVVPCPQCASLQTRLVSGFGSAPCKALYRCLKCREPFDYFKPH